MNFPWLIVHLGGWPTFLLLGLATQAVAVGIMFVLFRRRGWM